MKVTQRMRNDMNEALRGENEVSPIQNTIDSNFANKWFGLSAKSITRKLRRKTPKQIAESCFTDEMQNNREKKQLTKMGIGIDELEAYIAGFQA